LEDVQTICEFGSLADVHKALKTAIGHYRKEFSREDLAKQLLDCANEQQIFLPSEGQFDVFSKITILNAFRHLKKLSLIVEMSMAKREIRLT